MLASQPLQLRPTRRIVFLESDHVLDLARMILEAPDDRALPAFFAPDEVSTDTLRNLGAGLRANDGWTITQLAPGDPPPPDTEAILLRRGRVDAATIDACPRLRIIQRLGERPDGLDLDHARRVGIEVRFQPRTSLSMVAEHVFALMLALAKRLLAGDQSVRGSCGAGREAATRYNWPGLSGISGLAGKTLGIVGPGEVGRQVAERARAFGMPLVFSGRASHGHATIADAAELSLPELLSRADIVSLHVQGDVGNRHLIDASALAAMRPGALLINTSRGSLIDEAALLYALRSGRLSGAGLDVHAAEPRALDDPLFAAPNLLLTPHVAAGSRLVLLEEIGGMFDAVRAHLGRPTPVSHPPTGAAK